MNNSGNDINKNNTLSVIIPVYNEEDGIAEIITRVLAVHPELYQIGIDVLELIVVDDGSSDRTVEIVRSIPEVRLIIHPVNKGYGAALKTGFSAGKGKLLGFLDADGTYPPDFFPKLCLAGLNGAQLVVGSRRSGADSEMPLVRKIGNFFWSSLVSLICGTRVIDPASGMRVFHKDILEEIYPLPDGLNFTPVMSTRALHEGISLVEIPITYKERQGRSKLNVIRDGILFLQTILWTAMYYNPVRILGGIGLACIAFSVIFVLILLTMRLSGITSLGPLGVAGTYLAVFLGIAGVNIFALGVIFNYLVSLFHRRPVRQGLFGRPIFSTPLDNHFWWMGTLLVLIGIIIYCASFIIALGNWPIERLWLYLLGATMLLLVGFQLVIYWIIVRILDELNKRDILVENDLRGQSD